MTAPSLRVSNLSDNPKPSLIGKFNGDNQMIKPAHFLKYLFCLFTLSLSAGLSAQTCPVSPSPLVFVNNSIGEIIQWDVVTGVRTPICSGSAVFGDIAMDINGTMWAVEGTTGDLVTVDLVTCASTVIVPSPVGTQPNALSFLPNGNVLLAQFGSTVVTEISVSDSTFTQTVWHDFGSGGPNGDFVFINGKIYALWFDAAIDPANPIIFEVDVDADFQYISQTTLGPISRWSFGLAKANGGLFAATSIGFDGGGNPPGTIITIPIPNVSTWSVLFTETQNLYGATSPDEAKDLTFCDVNISKVLTTGGPAAQPTEPLTYTISLTNTGTTETSTAAGTLIDTVPLATHLTATVSGDFTCDDTIAGSICRNTAAVILAAGQTVNLTFDVVVDSPIPMGITSIDNVISLQGIDCALPSNDCVESTPIVPTAVAIGEVSLKSVLVSDYFEEIGINNMSQQQLLDIFAVLAPDLAASLTNASTEEILQAFENHIDPDGNGQIAIFRWDTIQQLGTIGFYVHVRQPGSTWTLINDNLLPSLLASPLGAEYQLVDRLAVTGGTYQYRLTELEAQGNTREYGPFTLTMP